MSELYRLIAQLGLDLHPDRITVIASKIESLESAKRFDAAKASFGPNIDASFVEKFGKAWQKSKGIGPSDLAAALRGAAATATLYERNGEIELVWTGPSTTMVPVRHTEQVLSEVIETAKSRLFVVSFVAYHVDSIVRKLRAAVERQVSIRVLLESSSEHGGKVSFDSVKAVKNAVPETEIYIWGDDPGKAGSGQSKGAVHAKCAVADGETAFITSANLSTAAMERNMELGVLVKGGHIPDSLHRHLDALVTTGVVKKVLMDTVDKATV